MNIAMQNRLKGNLVWNKVMHNCTWEIDLFEGMSRIKEPLQRTTNYKGFLNFSSLNKSSINSGHHVVQIGFFENLFPNTHCFIPNQSRAQLDGTP